MRSDTYIDACCIIALVVDIFNDLLFQGYLSSREGDVSPAATTVDNTINSTCNKNYFTPHCTC
jgi:hypothetical protein